MAGRLDPSGGGDRGHGLHDCAGDRLGAAAQGAMISKSFWLSFDFLCRYWATGLALGLTVGLAVFGQFIGIAFLVHFVGSILILPGAILINAAGLRLFPARTWAG